MHFATYLPDWNSLDSVRRAHSDLEAVALVFFALLVVFDLLAHLSSENKTKETLLEKIALICFAVAVLAEIAAYPYGQRNDTLSEKVIGSLDAKAKRALENASTALDKSGTALSNSKEAGIKSTDAIDTAGRAQKEADSFEKDIVSAKTLAAEAESHLADALQRAANAERELSELKAKSAPRRLTPAQEQSIASQLSLPSQPVDLLWYASSSEGEHYGTDIFNAINNMAHWDVKPTRYTAGQSCLPPCPEAPITGLVIFTMPTDRSEKAGKELYNAFRNAHVPVELAPISAWWLSYSKMSFKRDSLAREDARLVVVVGNHP